jgi:N4-gp56 family major capsid protein
MAAFTWEFDVPSGTWKNHALSAELRRAAIAQVTFAEHARTEKAFGRKSGESVTLARVKALDEPATAEFGENQLIPEDTLTPAVTSITVKRLGRAVVFSEDVNILSKYDMEDPIQSLLRDQMSLVLDTMAAAAFKQTNIKASLTGASSITFTTNGSGAPSTAAFTLYHLEELRDYLYDDMKAPMVNNDHYVMIARTKSIRGLMRDQAWQNWYVYTNPQGKYNHELGRMEGVRIIETNHDKALGRNSTTGEVVIFGNDAVTMIEAYPPELRMGIPRNFGLLRGIAWYGRVSFGLTWGVGSDLRPGEDRVVHVVV